MVSVTNCLFYKNSAIQTGAAIFAQLRYIIYFGSLTISNTIFDSNQAGTGGAAIMLQSLEGVVENSIFINNRAYFGGAIYFLDLTQGYSNIRFTNCTMDNNTAKQGGFMYSWVGSYEFDGNIFTNNFAKQRGMEIIFICVMVCLIHVKKQI